MCTEEAECCSKHVHRCISALEELNAIINMFTYVTYVISKVN
jgi:hypothetical protein